jgi:hypothetical protein
MANVFWEQSNANLSKKVTPDFSGAFHRHFQPLNSLFGGVNQFDCGARRKPITRNETAE